MGSKLDMMVSIAYICNVGIAGDCIIALAAMSLAGQDAGLQAESARLCASMAAMPHK